MDGRGAPEALGNDPRYAALVRRRVRFAGALTGVMLLAYFGFVLLVAFAKPWLGSSLAGGATSVGIPVGLGVIAVAVVVTGVYVRQANRVFDPEMARLVSEHGASERAA